MRVAHVTIWLLLICRLSSAQTLPGTGKLDWSDEDLSTRLMDGAHRFVERKIDESEGKRAQFWNRDFSTTAAYENSVASNRERLRTIIGAVDQRLPPMMERYGDDTNPALIAETPKYRVSQVRWPVLEGLWGSGLLIEPVARSLGHVILIPDAAESPERHLFGDGQASKKSKRLVARLAENGFTILIPVTVSRDKLVTDDELLKKSDQTYREWLYRQAFHLGRHVVGYEVQTVQAAIDWLKVKHGSEAKVGVCGHAEGGLTALYAAAIDSRINATLVSGYFDRRQKVWSEPIYRNVWGLLREFGDAEIAGLILPRGLVIEHSPGPEVSGHKGEWQTPSFDSVRTEFERIKTEGPLPKPDLVKSDEAYSDDAVTKFAAMLGAPSLIPLSAEVPHDRREKFDSTARHLRYAKEIEGHVQQLLRRSDKVRDEAFLFKVMPELAGGKWSTEQKHPTHDATKFIAGAKAFREQFHTEAMGRFDEPLLPPNARSRVVAETNKWTAYDIVLDVYPEFFAWGVLVLPKDLKPGERRPVVVCQHGRNGVPLDLVNRKTTAYNDAAAVLAERGFITFAPHNLYRGEDRYRCLCRKANNVKATLFSFIISSHDQITRWLATQPFVDPDRIAFYGLSYGGETAVRVPPILERYCLSICSGDFNQWTRKVASTDEPFSFMRTIEWEMPYWNLGQTFDYAEMSYLMIPRPFMVERGHHDRVGRDQWVAHEYAKVRWLYAQLGLVDRTEIEFFQGGHSMNLQGTVQFLEKHLR